MSYKQTSPIPILEGGTNTQSFVHAFGVAYYDGGSLNNIDPGISGYVLTSNGNSAPSFQSVSVIGVVSSLNGDSGSATPSAGAITVSGGTIGLTTVGSGSSITLTGTLLPSHGGTGAIGTATSGYILIGNGTVYVPAAVGSGTGVTVTAGAGTMSIATSAVLTAATSSGTATVSSNNITFTGAGTITTSASGSTVTITGAASGVSWVDQTTTPVAMAVNNAYSVNNAGLVTLTLPSTAAFGSIIQVSGYGAGGWLIAQNSGQTIHFGAVNTTTGAGGSLASTNRYDQVTLVCAVANTDWVVNSSFGNITYV